MRSTLTLVSLAAAALAAATAAMAAGNPASAYCESRGGKVVETVPGANGGERGICVLPSGTRIDEWVLLRNTHRTTR